MESTNKVLQGKLQLLVCSHSANIINSIELVKHVANQNVKVILFLADFID